MPEKLDTSPPYEGQGAAFDPGLPPHVHSSADELIEMVDQEGIKETNESLSKYAAEAQERSDELAANIQEANDDDGSYDFVNSLFGADPVGSNIGAEIGAKIDETFDVVFKDEVSPADLINTDHALGPDFDPADLYNADAALKSDFEVDQADGEFQEHLGPNIPDLVEQPTPLLQFSDTVNLQNALDATLFDPAAPGPTLDPALLDASAPGDTIDPALLDPSAPGETLDPAQLEHGIAQLSNTAEPAGLTTYPGFTDAPALTDLGTTDQDVHDHDDFFDGV
jgi:hypothetical protein